jgi:hypothetical protein
MQEWVDEQQRVEHSAIPAAATSLPEHRQQKRAASLQALLDMGFAADQAAAALDSADGDVQRATELLVPSISAPGDADATPLAAIPAATPLVTIVGDSHPSGVAAMPSRGSLSVPGTGQPASVSGCASNAAMDGDGSIVSPGGEELVDAELDMALLTELLLELDDAAVEKARDAFAAGDEAGCVALLMAQHVAGMEEAVVRSRASGTFGACMLTRPGATPPPAPVGDDDDA